MLQTRNIQQNFTSYFVVFRRQMSTAWFCSETPPGSASEPDEALSPPLSLVNITIYIKISAFVHILKNADLLLTHDLGQ